MEESKQRQKAAANASREEAKHKEDEKKSAKAAWSVKETATLIKAVKLFPGGTIDRYANWCAVKHVEVSPKYAIFFLQMGENSRVYQ